MATKRLGKAYIKVDGELLETMPKAKLDLGGDKRDPVVGDNAVLGYAEQVQPSKLEATLAFGPNTSLAKLRAITDATVTFECDTGQTFIVANAWVGETLALTAGEGGEVGIVMYGPPAVEA